MSAIEPSLDAFQERLGHAFADPALLVRALTHGSYANETGDPDNERLEFLGDAVLSACLTPLLLARHPTAREGLLSRLRSRLVNTGTLALVARSLALGASLRLGRGEEGSGGRDKDTVLADAMEAVLGALFLDAGFAACQRAVARWFDEHIEACDESFETWRAPRSELQEVTQERWHQTPRYEVVESSGPAHAPTFEVQVFVGDRLLGRGTGGNKREASSAAAIEALRQLGEPP